MLRARWITNLMIQRSSDNLLTETSNAPSRHCGDNKICQPLPRKENVGQLKKYCRVSPPQERDFRWNMIVIIY
jgi:hypothetical protein